MQRLLWPLGLVVAFGLGLAAGDWLGHGLSPTQEIELARAAESRPAMRLGAGGSGLHVEEVRPGERQDPTVSRADHFAAGDTVDAYARRGRLERDGSLRVDARDGRATSSRIVRDGTSAALAVAAALDRFHLYLDETTGSEGLARWQRMQEIADELRNTGPAAGEALMRALMDGTTSDERRAAAQLLGELQVPGALPLLQDILEQGDDVLLRRAAAAGLRRLQMPEAIPVLEELLADPKEDRSIRKSAAFGLAQQGRSQGVTALMQTFEESRDRVGRNLAFGALMSLNDERALPFMRQLVASDVDASFRLPAIHFLTAQGDRQALASLQQIMRSPAEKASIRDAAAKAHTVIAGVKNGN